ncbi:MAG: flavodoxin family protein [Gammaproteobacteria bacterium]|nr:flavodoxin family protein [Gammaproteobacteria bacterium]
MGKRILILNGNPKPDSLCAGLAAAYGAAAATNHQVRPVALAQLGFESDLNAGYDRDQPLEPDLQAFQRDLLWAEHLVLVAPVWWGGVPARLKGLIDRTFLPGFAFRYEKGQVWPTQLLKGRTATLLLTLDTPPWYYRLLQGAPAVRQLDTATLAFSGFKPVRHHLFGPVIHADDARRQRWLDKAQVLGARAG